jgi:hypothetical protein
MRKMVRVLDTKFLKTGCAYREMAGLSTDDKPTEGLATGSVFMEVDSGDVYLFDEESSEWNKVGGE